jgi:multisubunit Na+/H+ antiporter MnhG subunit
MLTLGALTVILAIGIFACDHNNEFLIILFPLALVLLGIGLVME